ncbi:MAG: Nif11-like leader peptide family RiPP precursor [Thermotaleaceae bacterium]
MKPELELLFAKMSEDKAFAEKLAGAQSPEAVQSIAAESGLTLTIEQVMEAKEILEKALASKMGELSDEDLDEVAGGAVTGEQVANAVAGVINNVVDGVNLIGGGIKKIFSGW